MPDRHSPMHEDRPLRTITQPVLPVPILPFRPYPSTGMRLRRAPHRVRESQVRFVTGGLTPFRLERRELVDCSRGAGAATTAAHGGGDGEGVGEEAGAGGFEEDAEAGERGGGDVVAELDLQPDLGVDEGQEG